MYFILPTIYAGINIAGVWEQVLPQDVNTTLIKIIWLSLSLILDIVINALLLYLYVKALHHFAIEQYFRSEVARANLNGGTLLDDRQDELMLEATRYTVLFSILLIINVVGISLGIIIYICLRTGFHNVGDCIFMVCVLAKDVGLLVAIQFSFKFSHSTYEKRCQRCDKWMKHCCRELVRKSNMFQVG